MASPTVPPDLAIETLIQLSQVATIGKYLSGMYVFGTLGALP